MNDSKLWRLYAVLTECCDVSLNNQQKIVQYLQKAQRIASQEQGWEQTVEQCKNVINLSLHLSSGEIHKRISILDVPVQFSFKFVF